MKRAAVFALLVGSGLSGCGAPPAPTDAASDQAVSDLVVVPVPMPDGRTVQCVTKMDYRAGVSCDFQGAM